MTGGFEMFDRDHPPAISVYSPRYVEEVRKRVQAGLAPMKGIERIYSVFPFQDEPFHAGPASFDIINHEAAEPQTTVRLGDLKFRVGQIEDIESGKSVDFKSDGDFIQFPVTVPLGTTQLLRVRAPAERLQTEAQNQTTSADASGRRAR
jgi:hypothetical protein